jgi:hypothetical protein
MNGRRRQKEAHIMYRGSILHVSSWGRLALGLCLLVGLCLALAGQARPAHAQTILTVTNCSNDSQLQADVSTANNDNAGDTITFSCSGDIKLTSTLTLTGSMTLDGSNQSVTLDGGGSVEVLRVTGGAGTFTLNALTVAHGHTNTSNGGGLINAGTLSISNSTFANNFSPAGGGLFNEGTVSISNSTFVNNSSANGGGFFNVGTASISNSTFVNNSSPKGGGLLNFNTVTISGSLVANNTGSNCSGGLSDQGYNLSSDSSCGFTGPGDLQNTDPKLDPNGLQNNGGPTQTIALQSTSPAIDQIPMGSKCSANDQRNFIRPDDTESTCDIGAYESGAQPDTDLGLSNLPKNITTDATSPQGAVVSYTPTVVDEDSPLPTANCSPISGSVFPIGTTTVTCTVSDSDDTNSPVSGSFQVVVVGASGQVTSTISLVNSFGLPADIQAGFDTQLQAVQTDLTNNNPAQACSDLTAFINHIQAQSGKHLTVSQANQLLAAAKQVQAVLGC